MGGPETRAIVIGAGIGGLSAAIALRRIGIPVTVLERSAELREVGAGIQIWANGMAALDRLGLADEVARLGEPLEEMSFTSWRGQPLLQLPVGELARAAGVRLPVIVRRPDLLHALAEGAGEGTVRLGSDCVGYEQDGDGVTVRLADGREERGALVVAADGADSLVRMARLPQAKPRYAGYQYLRALCDLTDPRVPAGAFQFSFGRAHRFGIHAGVYWFGVVVTPPGTVDSPAGRKRDLLECFRDFAEPVPTLVESVPDETIGRTDIRDLEPLERWVDGRVVIVGDAAHATTPNLGRGAGEAIEDAITLAACLEAAGSLADGEQLAQALARFEQERRPATAAVQTKARRIGQMLSWRGRAACAAREAFMRTAMGRIMERETRTELAALAARLP